VKNDAVAHDLAFPGNDPDEAGGGADRNAPKARDARAINDLHLNPVLTRHPGEGPPRASRLEIDQYGTVGDQLSAATPEKELALPE
jgi:hypothetical protein